jgi:hypothetical protein
MSWLAAIFLKYFAALLYALLVWAISAVVWNLLPEGRVRRALFTPLRIRQKQRVQAVSRQIGRRR